MMAGPQATFASFEHPKEALAAIDAQNGMQWTYGTLQADVRRIQAALPELGRKSLGLILAQNRYECLTAYLAAIHAGSALILLDASLDRGMLHDLLEIYQPDWIFSLQADLVPEGCQNTSSAVPGLWMRTHCTSVEIHPDLALLLSTSGSTGTPKLVRLSLANLVSNARSIAEYLQLTPGDRPITSLPMPYSYGLSVINSHLHAGAAIVFTEDSVLRREFWDSFERYGCTSMAGVPITYQLMLGAGVLAKRGSSLQTLTQAGGRLDERLVRQMLTLAETRGWRFFVMYGQTEATARITYVPSDQLSRKIGSVGVAIPGGSLTTDQETGELIYTGPNVMMGYATCRQDLARGNELHGVLRTGDLARMDADGYVYLTGRLKRFLKIFGKRFSLDEVESLVARELDTSVACFGADDLLQLAVEGPANADEVREVVCRLFDLPRTAVCVGIVSELPRTSNGKLNYKALSEAAQPAAAGKP
jgi:acyl-CoA synthetase (AMP-forming)/AMP-acid ligase II